MSDITQKKLKKLLHYNSETGVFTWLVSPNTTVGIGDIAGGYTKNKYVQIQINGKKIYAHRLAWLYMEGYFPENGVDHINRVPNDNKWSNLRHVTHQCNLRNCKKQKNNTSGVTGVLWYKPLNKWVASITVNRKNINLGYSYSFAKTVNLRWEAEKKYNFPNCNSSSSAYLYLRSHSAI